MSHPSPGRNEKIYRGNGPPQQTGPSIGGGSSIMDNSRSNAFDNYK